MTCAEPRASTSLGLASAERPIGTPARTRLTAPFSQCGRDSVARMTATLDRPAAPELEPPSWRDRLQPLVTGSGGWAVTLAITVLAGLLRFLRLDQPATTLTAKGNAVGPGQMFDELYYACDAHSLMLYSVEHHSTTTDGSFCQLDTAPA